MGFMVNQMAEIMIVDDEPTIQQLLSIILEDMGHSIIAQSMNGEEAMKTYFSLEPHPDLIIIDHRIPIMSGTDLARNILEKVKDQKMLFLSADESIRERIMDLGIDNFLEKPADIGSIRGAVKKALSQ